MRSFNSAILFLAAAIFSAVVINKKGTYMKFIRIRLSLPKGLRLTNTLKELNPSIGNSDIRIFQCPYNLGWDRFKVSASYW